ncbi:ketosteroid isomerase [Brevundimonas sp. LM2]|uniref:nuclear transport factor 2 family protein n=1 Tax=Brevundimonas sp. LM2 TaxID=1938605 RepID=UPI0009838D43|nr:nuclear transport factor 2 family protein [Brevundimonas sp. LM2]AQR61869.1 ketosteroid isomerase [Brevundimonas sp. LM2]
MNGRSRRPRAFKPLAFVAVLVGSSLAATSHTFAQTDAATVAMAQNGTFIASAFDRWAAGGADFFATVLSQDVVWTIEGSGPSAGTYRGLEDFTTRAIRPFATRMREPVRPVATEVWAEGDHVIARWEGRGVAGDGRPYQNDYVWIFRMENGRAVEVTAFLDLPAYDDVLRRVPAAPAESDQP